MFKRVLITAITAFVLSTAVQAAGPAPTRDQQQFEIRFMTEMIDHHAMAVMMADLCLERAIHPELRQLCHNIKESQTEEIVTMQIWLEDWYGIEHQPEMTPGMRNQMEKLASLTGAEFEVEFMKMMIRHHWKAVVRAQQCQEKAYHPQLIELCEEMETKQLAEIELMGTWLCTWYSVCNYHGSTD
jgi:uncharacterized protein (DUF305 family)